MGKMESASRLHPIHAPGLIKQIMEKPELLRTSGDEKELTAFFSDIPGFTRISEGLSPTALVDILNEYFTEMTDIIFKHWGTLDKYIGDAIMAFWGAPYVQEDHAVRACRTALEMQQALVKLQSRWEAQGLPRIDVRMGINSGPMWVGNMGSKRCFNFTIMGANVNLARRLVGTNTAYGTCALIGENTCEAVRNEMLVRELDIVHIKGRAKPERIFELVATLAEADQHRDRIDRFGRGLQAFREENWTTALEIFEALVRDYPCDGPSRVFMKRCQDSLHMPHQGV